MAEPEPDHISIVVNDTPATSIQFAAAVTFDGHLFTREAFGVSAPWFYLAARARRGDRLAVEAITVAGLTITDLDGKKYWPAEDLPEPEPHVAFANALLDGDPVAVDAFKDVVGG